MLQIVWCCKMNKCGLIVAGVFGCIAAVILAIFAILWLVGGQSACAETYYYEYDEAACWSSWITLASLGLAGCLLWIATAVCTFVFACGSRMAKFQSEGASGEPAVPAGATVVTYKSSVAEVKAADESV